MVSQKVRNMILIALFAALMVVGAYLKIPNPLFPVYFTFQGVFCAFAGLLLGSKNGAASMCLYVLMGLAGLPVFSSPSGPQYIFHPTFGFLLGFIAAAFIIGKISESSHPFTLGKAFLASFSGLFVIFLTGICYMYLIYTLHMGRQVGFGALVSSMSLYFVKDFILFVFVAVLSVQIKKRLSFMISVAKPKKI